MFGGFPFEEMFGGGGGGRRRMPQEDEDPELRDTEILYKTLNIEKSASATEIKKAFRKLSRKYHPDRPNGDEAKFKEIQEAYEVLSDTQKRELYDEGGMKAVKDGGVETDPFSALFGGRGRRRGAPKKEKASAITKTIDVTLDDVYKGPTVEWQYEYLKCEGRKTCSRCDGRGVVMEVVRQGFMQIQTQRPCRACDGRGFTFAKEEKKRATARVPVPEGVRHGDKVTLRGEGHDIPGVDRGDVVVTVRVRKHKVFERVGADLACKKTLTLREALCGHTFTLEHVSGNSLKITSLPGEVTFSGAIKKVADWGLPQKGGHFAKGHLYIKYDIVFPVTKSISAGDIATLDAILSRCSYPEIKEKEPEIEVGARVKIVNLSQYPQFNNKRGHVFAETRQGRWGVELQNGKQLSVPAEKLELIADTPKPKRQKSNDLEDDDVYEEEVTPELIEGEPDTTPAVSASAAYDEEEQQERVHECRSM